MKFRPVIAVLLALSAQPAIVQAENIDSGAYLAARVAGASDDYREAAHWFTRALIASPQDVWLMEGAIAAQLGAGNMAAALAVAQQLQSTGATSPTANLVLIADQAKRGDYAALQETAQSENSGARLLDGLVNAWAELGAGKMSEALAEFDTLAKTDGMQAFGLFHKSLALASVGDYETAESILSGEAAGTINVMRRGVLAHIQILSQLERNEDAIALLDKALGNDSDPELKALRAKLVAGETVPYDIVRNVTDGLGEVFFTLALALNGEASDAFTLQYARVAAYLRPDHSEAILLAGAMLENQKQFTLATEAYAAVPQTGGSFLAAEIGRARALKGSDKLDAALEVLNTQIRAYPEQLPLRLALADMLSGAKRWEEASAAYDAAVDLIPQPPVAGYWAVYYSRAITLERQKLWDRAEADFRMALSLQPEQPLVLNYLGYSFLERGENYDEALEMIERAVIQRPGSGYIIDSLAWGYFLAGRYEDAVIPMERASVLEPVDATVTDHLGDVYWAVGRKLEANFQWRRALSFNPEEELATRLRRKLEIGLDAVLAEEGAKPLATDDN
ncbi:tetratricopeptide repeat protein [Pseudorhodobacter turbinis]|uniref:Tetratricopeptide repeat protein n=1 Tax=Pseudorhodobacter turbinis TaxID=2500533 RepID=A0A4P8EHN6_9RHOB|nr:tetratricopeptide repeat protein [Pseudorhodobacter turbinis]QCO56263.1 tetratricopeptide repeat protein [Pseudorhodobacter turbinis]